MVRKSAGLVELGALVADVLQVPRKRNFSCRAGYLTHIAQKLQVKKFFAKFRGVMSLIYIYKSSKTAILIK